MKFVITSLYANPCHIGHLRYINEAKKLGDYLIAVVNSDLQVKVKGSFPFMNEKDRMEIISNLKPVNKAVLSIDEDGTVSKTLSVIFDELLITTAPWEDPPQFIFAKGGDRRSDANMPEAELEVCRRYNCQIVYGVGGFEKVQSSSELVANAQKLNLNQDKEGV